jgi:hypothetical protein
MLPVAPAPRDDSNTLARLPPVSSTISPSHTRPATAGRSSLASCRAVGVLSQRMS